MSISIIVAVSDNGVIGKDNQIPWKLSSDLKRFKKLTLNSTLIMGRKTFESIGSPLPNRVSIVLSRNPNYEISSEQSYVEGKTEGAFLAPNLDKAISLAPTEDIFIVGGERVFEEGFLYADTLYLTEVHTHVSGGTAFFPDYEMDEWEVVEGPDHSIVDDSNEFPSTFQTLKSDS